MKSQLYILFILFMLFVEGLNAKVDPPNYDFSLERLSLFMPGKNVSELAKEYSNGTKMEDANGGQIIRYYVEHLRYRFPIFVLIKGDKIDSFFATLPSYFLHDVFHQSLINRYGMQNSYKKVEESAVYIWNNVEGNTHVYSGTCTITCFPIYYSVYPATATDDLLKKFVLQSNYQREVKQAPNATEAQAL